jgi:hypothetical protein
MRFPDFWKKLFGGSVPRQTTPVAGELENDEDAFADPFNPFPDPVEIQITDVFDLHTIPARDVKLVVEEYLDQAASVGLRSVRIIHGKGIGVQREMVRSILARTSFVIDWTDAPPEAGGLGATIVRLRKQERQN